MNLYKQWMGIRVFMDEPARRERLEIMRQCAAQAGYHGHISFRHVGIHGRTRGYVEVTIYV